MNEQLKSKLHKLEDVIGYHFKDLDLLKVAVSHTSYVNELRVYKWESYQRMEYLGDAVLELVISDYLYRNNPDMSEGVMSKTRSSIVCETALSYCARLLQVELTGILFCQMCLNPLLAPFILMAVMIRPRTISMLMLSMKLGIPWYMLITRVCFRRLCSPSILVRLNTV